MSIDKTFKISGLLKNKSEVAEKYRLLNLDLIHEDENQPRKHFATDALDDLIASIKERGVKTPISVREQDGKFVINHGARRFRAAKAVGLKQIPAVIDNEYTFIDQIIENIQRSDLTTFELAAAIDKLIRQGMKKGEIAKKLGKSGAFVTQYSSISNAPEILKNKLKDGIISDVTVFCELLRLYKEDQEKIEDFLNTNQNRLITRETLKQLKDFLESEDQLTETELMGLPLSDTDKAAAHENITVAEDVLPGHNKKSEYFVTFYFLKPTTKFFEMLQEAFRPLENALINDMQLEQLVKLYDKVKTKYLASKGRAGKIPELLLPSREITTFDHVTCGESFTLILTKVTKYPKDIEKHIKTLD